MGVPRRWQPEATPQRDRPLEVVDEEAWCAILVCVQLSRAPCTLSSMQACCNGAVSERSPRRAALHRFDLAQAIVECKPAQRARLEALLAEPVRDAVTVALKIKPRTAALRRQLKRVAQMIDAEHSAAEVQTMQVHTHSRKRNVTVCELAVAHRAERHLCLAGRGG